MDTVNCHWLPTICGAGDTAVHALDARFVLHTSVKSGAGNGQDSVRVLPDAETLMSGLTAVSLSTVTCLTPVMQELSPDQEELKFVLIAVFMPVPLW